MIIGRNVVDNNKVIAEIESSGARAFQVVAELSDPHQGETAVMKVMEKYGAIDGLVNNAGVNDGVGLEDGD